MVTVVRTERVFLRRCGDGKMHGSLRTEASRARSTHRVRIRAPVVKGEKTPRPPFRIREDDAPIPWNGGDSMLRSVERNLLLEST